MEDNKKEINLSISDTLYAFFLLCISFYFWNTVKIFNGGAGTTVFTCVFIMVTCIYFFTKKIKYSKKAIFYLIISALASFYFLIFDNELIEMMMFAVMFFFTLFWIAHLNKRLIDNEVGSYIFGDLINLLIVIPFENIGMEFCAIKGTFKNDKKSKNISEAIIGVVVMIPVLVVVIVLLSKADAGFEKMINDIFGLFDYIDFSIIWKILLSIPTACYIGGLVFGSIYSDRDKEAIKQERDEMRDNCKIAPRAGVYSALISINFIYVLFIISQFGYLFDAMNGVLPEELTYAEYARRGFFEICVITGINMAVLLAAHIFIRKEDKEVTSKSGISGMLRVQGVILCLFTTLLIATAISKMGMYIWTYGLTYLRTLTSCFLVYMLFVVISIIVRQYKKYSMFRNVFIGAAIGIIIVGYANIDGVIANYNINRYLNEVKEGNNCELDYECLEELSDGAAPYLKELYNSEYASSKDKEEIEAILKKNLENKKENLSFSSYNFMTSKRVDISNEIIKEN